MSGWEHDFIYGTSLRWRRDFYYGRPIYRRMKKEAFAKLERILDERLRSSEEPEDNLTAIIKASREAGQTVSRCSAVTSCTVNTRDLNLFQLLSQKLHQSPQG